MFPCISIEMNLQNRIQSVAVIPWHNFKSRKFEFKTLKMDMFAPADLLADWSASVGSWWRPQSYKAIEREVEASPSLMSFLTSFYFHLALLQLLLVNRIAAVVAPRSPGPLRFEDL